MIVRFVLFAVATIIASGCLVVPTEETNESREAEGSVYKSKKGDYEPTPRFVFETKSGTNELKVRPGECGALELGIVDIVDGKSIEAQEAIEAKVTGVLDKSFCRRNSDATLTVYSDNICSKTSSKVTIEAGASTANFWVKADKGACFQMGAKAKDVETPGMFFVEVFSSDDEVKTDSAAK